MLISKSLSLFFAFPLSLLMRSEFQCGQHLFVLCCQCDHVQWSRSNRRATALSRQARREFNATTEGQSRQDHVPRQEEKTLPALPRGSGIFYTQESLLSPFPSHFAPQTN
jgi:hypothetical protein